jgi:murein DD-endopeptidase MepM/ murein hydrolase activator NlpD
VIFLLGLAIGGLGGFFLGRKVTREPVVTAEAPPPASSPAPAPAVARVPETKPESVVPATQPTAAPALPKEMRRLDLSISGSLYATLSKHMDRRQADILNAQVGRVLVWWFEPRRDVLKGDRVQLLFQPVDAPTELQLLAVRYTSKKMNKVYQAYRYRASGARYHRFYDHSGNEIELRLTNSPLDHYEQVTELMNKAGRRHRGVDFKTDLGTEVRASFKARVLRRNWSTHRNGNCLNIVYLDSGITALFLHLDEVLPATVPGKVVEAGTVIARSGNTGHSTAPHLHYELHAKSGKLLNPFKVHKTLRLKLEGKDQQDFNSQRERLNALLLRGESAGESVPRPSESIPSPATPG